jgi:hypothetical protein
MSLPKWKTAALLLLIAGLVLAGGLVTHHIFRRPRDPSPLVRLPDPSNPSARDWRPDPSLLKRLKTEFSFTALGGPDEPGNVQRFHYSLKFPDGASYFIRPLAQDLPIQSELKGKLPYAYSSSNEENIFDIPGGGRLLVYVKRASPEELEGRHFERSWDELMNQHQVARNFGGLEYDDIEEGMVNGSTFYRAPVTSKWRRGYAYVSDDGERAIYLVFTVPNDNGFEDAEKLAEAVVLTWQKH